MGEFGLLEEVMRVNLGNLGMVGCVRYLRLVYHLVST